MTTKEKTTGRAYNGTHFIQDMEAFVQVGGFITSLSQGWGTIVPHVLGYLGSAVDFAKSLNIKVKFSFDTAFLKSQNETSQCIPSWAGVDPCARERCGPKLCAIDFSMSKSSCL